MSGQQLGTVVGGVIGAFFGNPQLGMAIGGMIGGWIAPTEIKGPRIGDGQSQSSAEGMPIAWVLGTAGWLQGNIVQKSKRREVKKEDDGKGSGQVQVTYEAHQDFCIMICESSETRDSMMVGVLIVKVDGKIVYDMRPGSKLGAENSKFLKHHTFYDGNEAQLPDATMEADTGVGNTPYYRGVYTMVARDINLTPYGDRIPTYEFVMVGAGEAVVQATEALRPNAYAAFIDEAYPLAQSQGSYLIRNATRGGAPGYAFPGPFAGTSEALALFTSLSGKAFEYIGYKAEVGADGTVSAVIPQDSVVDQVNLLLSYNEGQPEFWVPYYYLGNLGDAVTSYPAGTLLGDDSGVLFRAYLSQQTGIPGQEEFNYTEVGVVWAYSIHPIDIVAERVLYAPPAPMGDPCLLGTPVQLPDDPGHVVDCAGVVSPAPTVAPAQAGNYLILVPEVRVNGPSNTVIFEQNAVGPVLRASDPNNTEAFWEAAAAAAGVTGSYPADFPKAVPSDRVARAEYTNPWIETDTLTVATAIERICRRSGLLDSDLDTADIAGTLMGYPIGQPYNGAECLRPLLTAYTCYGSEYDAQLHFHDHGEAIEIVIDPDDFIEGSDSTDEDTREQAVEYPRQISVMAVDPTQDYTARPQTERRITPDVRAIGEETMQVPVVLPPDQQRQLAAIAMKVSWARAQGKREFSVPYAQSSTYLQLVAGAPFALEGKRYIAGMLRLEEDDIHIEALYDRQSAYRSQVTATPALPPTPPPSNIGGITLFAGLNLPRLRSQDSPQGLYIGVAGLLPSWQGATLQMSTDDGATWTTAIASMTQASVMGYLTASVGDEPTDTLSVAVHGGTLNSITQAQFEARGNPAAVVSNGVAELLQFRDADEVDEDLYDLTTLERGGLGTTRAPHAQGDRFIHLGSIYFLPLDITLAGTTILFRPVTFGTAPDANAIYPVLFNPLFTGPQLIENYTDDNGEAYTDAAGNPYFKAT